jgi:hypothetical protein
MMSLKQTNNFWKKKKKSCTVKNTTESSNR